jgi:hypothetical protein
MSDETDAGQPEAVAGATERPSPKQSKRKTKSAGVVVEHTSRGRTRMRLSKELRTPEKMAAIQEQLSQHPDVQSVEINQRTGSVLIKHGHERDGREVIKETFEGAEVLAGLILEVPIGEEEEGGGGEYGKLDQTLADLTSRFDEWQARKTGIHGRGRVVASGIAGLGILQIALFGISLEMLPGPVLLYIAYDIHRKVSKEEAEMEKAKQSAAEPDDVSQPAGDAPMLAAAAPLSATAPLPAAA